MLQGWRNGFPYLSRKSVRMRRGYEKSGTKVVEDFVREWQDGDCVRGEEGMQLSFMGTGKV